MSSFDLMIEERRENLGKAKQVKKKKKAK